MKDIQLLKDDNHYYGKVGKKYLSNSAIGILLDNPKEFGKDREDDKNLLIGRYFHKKILEPQKALEMEVVDASSRNTNIYKDAVKDSKEDMLLLLSEKEETDRLVKTLQGNLNVYDMVYDIQNDYEVPAIGEVCGRMFKGKADIVCNDMLIDLKTTSKISDFRWSAKKYNYDSQAYIYQELFGKPLVFVVIEKGSGMMGVYTTSDEFILAGKYKVERGMAVYDKFFGESPMHNINDYVIQEEL